MILMYCYAMMASKLVFLLLSVYFTRVSCRGPELVVVPDSASVEYGSTIIMSCVAAAGFGSQPAISWSRNGQTVSMSNTENDVMINITSTIISTSEMTFVWSSIRMCNLVAESTGQFSCTAANSQGNVTQKWNIVIAGARAAVLVVVPQTQLVEYHNTVVMVCVAYGFPIPTITFNKDGTALDNTNVSGFTIIHKTRSNGNGTSYAQSTLVLCNIVENDIGGYSCAADNGISTPDSETWSLRVNIPAQLVLVPDSQRVKFGSTVFMVCIAYGYPLSSITFNMNGDAIHNSSEVRITEVNITMSGFTFTQSVLSICGIARNESAEYSCTAKNDHGTHSQAWNIALSHIPVPAELVLIPLENQTLRGGNSVFVSCIAYGIPLPSITWTRNGIALSNYSSDRVSSYDKTIDAKGHHLVHSILEICDLMEHDAGTYSCEALNTVGVQSFDWHITIERTDLTTISTMSSTVPHSIAMDITSDSESTKTSESDPESNHNLQSQTDRVIAIGSALGVFVTLTAGLLILVLTYLMWSRWKRRAGCWARRNIRTTPNGYVYAPPRTLPNNPLEISLKELVTRSIVEVPSDETERIYEPIDTIGPYAQSSLRLNFKYLASGSSIDSTEFATSFTTFTDTETKKQEDTSLVVENDGYVNIVASLPTLDTSKSNASPIPSTSQAKDYCTASDGSNSSPKVGDKLKTDETNYSVITLEAMESCSEINSDTNTVITNEGTVLSVGEDDYEPMKPGVL